MSLAVETPGAPAERSAGIVVCAEDLTVRSRIRRAVSGSDRQVVASADDVEAMIDGYDRPAPACVILAGKRPDKTMGEAAARIHAEFGEAPIVAVCVRAGAGDVRRAIGFGVDGVVLEQRIEDALETVVSAVCSGQTCVPNGHRSEVGAKVLTNREKQMLTLVAGGMTNSEIASTLFLAESTVKSHLSSAFGKLNVSSRHEAASVVLDPERARALGIILGPEHRPADERADQLHPPDHLGRQMNDLAIIVVSMNDAAWLGPCLRSIRRRAGGIRYEVVVVENGADIAETAAVIDAEFPEAGLIENENRGFAHGNNVGLRTCDARYVLFLNPDTELFSGELSDLVETLDERPEIGLVGVRHLTGGRLYPSIRNFPSPSRALGGALGAERWPIHPSWSCERVLDESAYERETDCDWTVGAFLLARGTALEAVGMMDERFFLYSEETDLCLRIKEAGWSVRHLPQMTIVHHAGKGGLNPKMEAQNSFARMQHARKHFGGVRRELYRMALITGYGLRWLVATCRRDADRRAVASASMAGASGLGEPPFVMPPQVAVSATARITVDEPIELETAV